VNRVALKRQAEEALRHDLQPGERFAVGSAATSDPSRWAVAAFLAVALAEVAAGLASLLGPLSAGPVMVLPLPVLGLGTQFLLRPVYVAVTDRRMICYRVSRLRRTLGRAEFAVPLAELRIVYYRSGRLGTSIRCEMAGRKPILLHAGRAGRNDFAKVEMVLARSGAFARLDPPYPSLAPRM
jgi:hypothetical protein